MRSATSVTSLPTLEKRTRSAAGMISTSRAASCSWNGVSAAADDPALDAVQHGAFHGRVIVPQQRRAVRHVEVDVALAVEPVEVRPLAAVDVERPSEVGVQPHRGGDAPASTACASPKRSSEVGGGAVDVNGVLLGVKQRDSDDLKRCQRR